MYTLIAASEQTSGYGTRGRAFYSPSAGLYFSLLVPKPERVAELTPISAVSAASAIDTCFGTNCGIKWANDLILGGKKVGGILTEAFDGFAVTGIGLNLLRCEFPGLPGAGYITESCGEGVRERLVANIVKRFLAGNANTALAEYRERSVLTGRYVAVNCGGVRFEGSVLGIDEDFRLMVRGSDGTVTAVSSAELRV
jgi:BirA family biotin operon repressor/biotin-[acetyl-CoA-carboxylase] ligase